MNHGWSVGITTLMYERLALGFGLQVRLRIALDGLVEMARFVEKQGRAITTDPVMRQNLAQLWIDVHRRLRDRRRLPMVGARLDVGEVSATSR